MISFRVDEDLRARAEWTFALYSLTVRDVLQMFLERAVEYPLLVYELGFGDLSAEALTEICDEMVGV